VPRLRWFNTSPYVTAVAGKKSPWHYEVVMVQ